MADIINKVKLPDNKTYNIEGSVHYVCGTQTAATGAWTGNLNLPALYDGLTIMYYLPWAGSGNATLNLTLSDGSTTGAKNCYYNTSRLTTHYGKGCNIIMTYHPAGSITVDGTATTDDRWIANANYADGNDTTTLRSYYSRPTVNTNGIKQYSLFAYTSGLKVSSFTTNNGTGTKTFNTTDYFDIRKIFYYNGSGNVAANAKLGNNTMSLNENLVDMRYTFNGVTTDASTSSLVAEKPVFICFDLTDMISSNFANTSCLAKLKSPYITQEMNDRDTLYVLVGYMHDSYRCSLVMNNLTYAYGPAGFNCFTTSDFSNYSILANYANTVNGHTVEKDVPSNAVFTDTNNRRGYYGTCSTAAATATKTVTLSNTDGWELVAGVIVGVKFSYTNTAENVTLNINSTGNKSIYYATSVYTGKASQICGTKNGITYYMYDGTNWVFINYSGNYTDSNTHRPINVDGTQTLGNNTTALNLKSGTNVTLTASSGDVTISSGKWTSASTGVVGDTTITISDSSITANSVIDVYTSNTSGSYIALKTLTSTAGSATITFNALTESTQFKLLIR